MKDILEFKAFNNDSNFHFTDKITDDFITLIESKSIYWGGGYDKDYVQGSLYCDEDLDIDMEAFTKEIVAFFQKLDENIKMDVRISI